jgi:GTPase
MLNELLGKQRVVVSDVPGTTRDTIQVKCMYKNQSIILSDTAGLKEDLNGRIERQSYEDTLRTIKFSNVVILMVDAQKGLSNHDVKIATMIEKEGRGLIIAANKWDIVNSPYQIAEQIELKLTSSLSQIKGNNII